MDITNNKFFVWLDNVAQKLNENKFLAAYQQGASVTMGVILVGAVYTIIAVLLSTIGVIESYDATYNLLVLPNEMTMGLLTLIISFTLGYFYAEKLGLKPLQNGVASMICFLLVAAPKTAVYFENGSFTGLSTDNLGATGMFVALIVGFVVVQINRICVEKNIVIKMPDVVPPALAAGFSSALPLFFAVTLWYALSLLCKSALSMDIPSLVNTILRLPLQSINSWAGVIILSIIQALFWFLGIHGSGILTAITFPIIMTDVYTNTALLAAGQAPIWTPMMAKHMTSILGCDGNIWALELLGIWRGKSERVRSVSKASVVPGAFSISEPGVFGYPIMYNATLFPGYLLATVVPVILGCVAGNMGILYPYITYIYAIVPFNLHQFFCTGFSIPVLLFDIALIPVCMLLYYPFFKMYDNKCLKDEQEEAAE